MHEDFFTDLAKARKAYYQVLEPVCRKWQLTHNELDLILFLYNNPGLNRTADVVSFRGLTKSHVSLSAAHLEETGLLVKRQDPSDRRTVRLELTDAALVPAREGSGIQQKFVEMVYEGIPAADVAVYKSVFSQIIAKLADMAKLEG